MPNTDAPTKPTPGAHPVLDPAAPAVASIPQREQESDAPLPFRQAALRTALEARGVSVYRGSQYGLWLDGALCVYRDPDGDGWACNVEGEDRRVGTLGDLLAELAEVAS